MLLAQTLDGGKYRLQGSPSPAFGTLAELVDFHKKKKAGLTTTLKEPCPAEHKPMAPDLSAATRDKWEIDRSEIELTGVLGQGQYGEVYRGVWKGTVSVAVKTMKEDTATSEDFLTELQVMKALKHANLVQLYVVSTCVCVCVCAFLFLPTSTRCTLCPHAFAFAFAV